MSKVIIVVSGGLVQSVYARRKDIEIEVLDLDISDYPEDYEILEKKNKMKRLKEINNSKSYKEIW